MIKFLADENVPPEIAELVRQFGYDVRMVKDTRPGAKDNEVFELANNDNRMVITYDLDFGKIFYFSALSRVGVLIIRIYPQTVERTVMVLKTFFEKNIFKDSSLKEALIIVGETKYRIRRRKALNNHS